MTGKKTARRYFQVNFFQNFGVNAILQKLNYLPLIRLNKSKNSRLQIKTYINGILFNNQYKFKYYF